MSSFDPSKRVAVRVRDIDRAQFIYNAKLYGKVLLIVAIPWVLVMWCILEWL